MHLHKTATQAAFGSGLMCLTSDHPPARSRRLKSNLKIMLNNIIKFWRCKLSRTFFLSQIIAAVNISTMQKKSNFMPIINFFLHALKALSPLTERQRPWKSEVAIIKCGNNRCSWTYKCQTAIQLQDVNIFMNIMKIKYKIASYDLCKLWKWF